jgi:hypothetical protein
LGVGGEERAMLARQCSIPAKRSKGRDLQERLKDFEALLRGVRPEEGYEWPKAEEREEAPVDDR